jgi:hypothetical protein
MEVTVIILAVYGAFSMAADVFNLVGALITILVTVQNRRKRV